MDSKFWQRRDVLAWGIGGLGVGIGGLTAQQLLKANRQPIVPSLPLDLSAAPLDNPLKILRDFDYGTVREEGGQRIREFRIEATTGQVQLNSVVSYPTWVYNGRIPGPTLRVTEGERVRVIFTNRGGHSHSMHFHGYHAAAMDGVRPIRNGATTTYEFTAEPYGIHLYHCHVAPVTRHIGKGLYGLFIVDPPGGRPPADEMILVMGGYDTNEDRTNEFYAFNGWPNYYLRHPIPIAQNQLIRVYLLNMIEWDAAASFHLHANMFQVYPTGRTLTPTLETDVLTMGIAERHILEFSYRERGIYMFHPHQDYMAEQGCMGHFQVVSATEVPGDHRGLHS